VAELVAVGGGWTSWGVGSVCGRAFVGRCYRQLGWQAFSILISNYFSMCVCVFVCLGVVA